MNKRFNLIAIVATAAVVLSVYGVCYFGSLSIIKAISTTARAETRHQDRLAPEVFLKMLEVIAQHGDLRDVRFVEKILDTHFIPQARNLDIDGALKSIDISYEPTGKQRWTYPTELFYRIPTGAVPQSFFDFRPLIALLSFTRIDNFMCVSRKIVDAAFGAVIVPVPKMAGMRYDGASRPANRGGMSARRRIF